MMKLIACILSERTWPRFRRLLTVTGLAVASGWALSSNAEIYPNEFYRIVAKHSSKCLDIEGASSEAGARLTQWTCHDGQNQQFRFTPTENGAYFIFSRQSSLALDVQGGLHDNYTQIIQWRFHGDRNQQFELRETGDGYYRIVARHSGKNFDVEGISTEDGKRIIQWEPLPQDNELFRLEQVAKPLRCDYAWPDLSSYYRVYNALPFRDDEVEFLYGYEAYGTVANTLRIYFRSTVNVTWWKGLEVLDSENNVVASLQTEGGRHGAGPIVMSMLGRNPATYKLRFLKATLLGSHTEMYCFQGIPNQLIGPALFFAWGRD
jgi:hypothetical protein